MKRLEILVTGASRGIGRSIALRFAAEGARVIGSARTIEALTRIEAEVRAAGGEFIACPMEVSDRDQVAAAVGTALGATDGKLDLLVNNAGIFDIISVWDLTPPAFTRMLEVNLFGPLFVTLACLDALSGGERPQIQNICSTAGRVGYPGGAAYGASKYGLRGLSDGMRADLGERGIRIATIYPDATDTEIFDSVAGDWDRASMNQPEDVAEVVWATYRAAEELSDVDVPPPRGLRPPRRDVSAMR